MQILTLSEQISCVDLSLKQYMANLTILQQNLQHNGLPKKTTERYHKPSNFRWFRFCWQPRRIRDFSYNNTHFNVPLAPPPHQVEGPRRRVASRCLRPPIRTSESHRHDHDRLSLQAQYVAIKFNQRVRLGA